MIELLNTLYVQTPGTSLHLDGDAIRVVHPDHTGRALIPLVRIDHLVLFAGTTITNDLLLRCADDTRSVSWLTGAGRFRARVTGPILGNPLLRHAQHQAADDVDRRLPIAQSMIAGKIHNSRQVLLRSARDTTGTRQDTLRHAAETVAGRLDLVAQARHIGEARGAEGIAARDYFTVLPQLVPDPAWTRGGRTKRPPTDPLNCLLSFLYGMLRVAVHGALEQIGLDPYLGYLHALRPGKPALALDLMEEFRPLLADRLAYALANRRELDPSTDFEVLPTGGVRLTDDARRTVLNAWQRSRQREWPHATLKRNVPAALLPLIQARLLARHLRDDLDAYRPWTVN